MDIFTRRELNALMERPNQIGVSIYQPTHPVSEKEQDPLRLKNLLKEAEKKVIEAGLRRPEAESVLEPAKRMVDDPIFWKRRGRGLAIYASPGYFNYYRTPHELPEAVTAGERFQLAPMMPLLYNNGRYYVLALSENHSRLLECTRDGCRDATPEDMPRSQAAAVRLDTPESHAHYHSTGTGQAAKAVAEMGSRATVGGGAQVWHGNSVLKDMKKNYIQEYFQSVERRLKGVWEKNSKDPLVLAAVDYLHPIYRSVNTYDGLMTEGVNGNPDDLTEQELHVKTWPLVEPKFSNNMRQALDNYHLSASKGLASADPGTILLAIDDGRVANLFVAEGRRLWGRYERDARRTSISGESDGEDLLDLAAVNALGHGAEVYVLKQEDIPDNGLMAAEFRY